MVGRANNKADRRPYFRLFGLAIASTLMFSTPAFAASVFLLQLGTSDSESQATQKWEEVKAKNGDVLSGLNLHVAEVVLPPKDAPSYRTQAGPIASREQAAKLCSTLKDRDVTCYVVETALMTSEAPTEEAKPQEAKEELKPVANEQKHTEDLAEESDAHNNDPDYVPPPVDSGPVIISGNGSVISAAPATIASAPEAVATEEEPPAPVIKTRKQPKAETVVADTNDEAGDHVVPGRGPRFLDENDTRPAPAKAVAAQPVVQATAEPQPQPQPTPTESRGFFGRLFGSNPPKPSDTQGVTGNVNVAEAVPVPLSDEAHPTPSRMVPVLPQVQGLGGSPSSAADKTLWAQISYFQDETQALNFYREFSAKYPQYTDGVRIRITKPFTATTVSGKVSLRVGPFAGADDVNTICSAAAKWNAHCTMVREIGSATVTTPTGRHGEHGKHAATSKDNLRGTYWVQLGSYTSLQEAWDTWNDIQGANAKLVKNVKPNVISPPLSSSEVATYRLRAGPFVTEIPANNLCTRLQAVGTDCLVVNDH